VIPSGPDSRPTRFITDGSVFFLTHHVAHFEEILRVMDHVHVLDHNETKRQSFYQQWMITIVQRCLASTRDQYDPLGDDSW